MLCLSVGASACFEADPLPVDVESSGGSTTAPATTTTESSADGNSTTTVEPDASTTSTGPDETTTEGSPTTTTTEDGSTSSSSSESSSSEETVGPVAACGDGVLDIATETCDDNNLLPGDLCDATCQVEQRVFTFTGAAQTLTLPAWVNAVSIEAWGAQGGGSLCCDGIIQDDGGLGGYAAGTVTVQPGATLTIYVGGQGQVAGAGGFGGGGGGGEWGGGGGGASDVRVGQPSLQNRVIVAAGGGGGNCGCPEHGAGGAGGGLTGNPGTTGEEGFPPGGGGTQGAGGAPGDSGVAGSPGQGGGPANDPYHIGGGGGGYYGGGSAFAAGGGGGSSYHGNAQGAATLAGQRAGNGEVRITPIDDP